jgi:hypothetical protein
MRDRRYFVIPLAALLAVLPLMVRGASCGHDFGFHLRNWLEVSSQWKQGVIFPHWEFTAAWDSGEPRFIFYPPLSWIIGAALRLFLPWIAVPTVFIWLALTASGFTMHRLAREWTTSSNALIAACFYMVHPYMLFTFYERAAYAELLAAAWIPLLLLGILRPRLTIPGIAIPICLLWLSNDPAAVMGCYCFALLGVIRVVSSYRGARDSLARFKEAATISAGTIFGIGLAAFYILPAAIEQHWVQINMPFMRGVRYQDNFAFGHIGNVSHDAILRTASLCGITLLVLSGVFAAISLLVSRHDHERAPSENDARNRATLGALALLTCVAAFLLTAPSAFLWKHVPELKYLQFPWRFCTILGATTAALSALAIRRARLHPAVATATALALTLAFTLGGDYFFRQPCYPAFAVRGIVHDFYYGGRYDPTDEYTPVDADPLALDHANPMLWIAVHPADPAPQTDASYSIALAHRLHFNVSSPIPGFAVLSLRDYPAWRITVNKDPVGARPHRKDGLIAVPINSGVSKIDIAYARTPDQTAGWTISALSGALLLFIWWKRERTASQQGRLRRAVESPAQLDSSEPQTSNGSAPSGWSQS